VLALACGGNVVDTSALTLGGETHFLSPCSTSCDEGLACLGGVCTAACEADSTTCSALDSSAVCTKFGDAAAPAPRFGGVCDVPCDSDAACASSGNGLVCQGGACRLPTRTGASESDVGSAGLALVSSADTSTCNSALRWVGGDTPSAEMRPGSDCVGCHEQSGARPLMLGGTVYTEFANDVFDLGDCFGRGGVRVMVEGADGAQFVTYTNRAGNFFFEGQASDLAMPYQASIGWVALDGTEQLTPMATLSTYGGCARCHGSDAEELSGPPQPFAFEDPDFVFPVPPIGLPGFLP
jgi:cytochrome c553